MYGKEKWNANEDCNQTKTLWKYIEKLDYVNLKSYGKNIVEQP